MTKLGKMLMEDGRAEGRVEGRAESRVESRVAMIRRKMEKGIDCPAIAEMLELEEDYVKQVIELITENPEKTDLEIAKSIAK